jgi:hypothetical protein
MRSIRCALPYALFMAAVVCAGGAEADTYVVDGIPMELALSPGLCPLSRSDPVAAKLYRSQDQIHAAFNSVVVIAVPCAGESNLDPTTYAIWLSAAPKGRATVIPQAYGRADVIGELAKTSETFDFDAASRFAEKDLKSHGAEVNVQRVGKVDQDAVGLYLATLQDVSQDGRSATVAGIVGTTVLHHRLLTYNMYMSYRDEESYAFLLPAVKRVLADTVLANPD